MIEAILTNNKRRRWNPFRRRRFVLRIPQQWDEVTPLSRQERWWRWAATLPAAQAKRKVILDLVPRRFRRDFSELEWGALAQRIEWITPRQDAEYIPMKFFYYRDTKYIFPTAKGPNVSCIEFALCDDYYKEAMEGNPDALLRLSACLWRPEDDNEREMLKRGDGRILLHSKEEVEDRVLKMLGVAEQAHLQALNWWIGMKMLVASMYGSWLFEQEDEPEEDEENPEPATSNNGPNFGWWGIFLDVAESGVFGNLDRVYQTSIHDVCIFLVHKRAASRQSQQPSPVKPPEED